MSQDITWLGSSRNHVGPAGPTRTLQLPNPRQTTSPFTTPSGKSGSDQAPRRNANQSRSRSTDSSGVRALCQRTRSAGRATCGQRIGPCHACRTTAQSLNNLLRNPAYAGRIQSRRWNSEHEGDFDPIVSEALYSGVQARLAAINSHPSVRQQDDPDFHCAVLCDAQPATRLSLAVVRVVAAACTRITTAGTGVAVWPPAKAVIEAKFVDLLDSLRPRPEYLALFRAIVLDVWRQECRTAADVAARLRDRVSALQGDLQRGERRFRTGPLDRSRHVQRHEGPAPRAVAAAQLELSEAQLQQRTSKESSRSPSTSWLTQPRYG
jgi:hypothetical protein